MSRRTKLGAVIISTFGLLAATGVWMSAAQGSSQPTSLPAWVALPAEAQSGGGVHLQVHDAVKHPMGNVISTQQAINSAVTRIDQTQAASAIMHTTFGDFSDDEYYTIMPDGTRKYVAQGIPAYIITFEGVTVPHLGPSTATNSEMNVVVNAATGDVIESFSYR